MQTCNNDVYVGDISLTFTPDFGCLMEIVSSVDFGFYTKIHSI